MSRLIVKNLPAYLTQQRLRAHFEASDGPGGILTDVKLVHNPDGTSRRFGFIGYKTPAEAERAKKWFNRTFVDSSRITVDVVDGAKDAPLPRPNKRPRLGPSPADAQAVVQVHVNSKSVAKVSEDAGVKSTKGGDQLDEYLQAMKPRTQKGPSWANDEPKKGKKAKPPSPEHDAQADANAEEPPVDEGVSDMDWFKRHTKLVHETPNEHPAERVYEQSDDESVDQSPKQPPDSAEEEPPPDPVKTTILQTARLFLRNLAFASTEDELRELFECHGEVTQVHIPLDSTSKQSKGLAYVTFAKAADALAAYEALDKTSFQGRLLHILPAVDRKTKAEPENGKRSVKDEREAKRKAGAGREFNWAMLYMNSDAVASSIADRMSISKADILNPDSGNAAVKLALAETHIINETKSFFESHGVVLSAFSARQQRSDTIVLVKNIPYGTSADTLRTMFGTHGDLRRVLVPPAGTLAVVEFEHAADARNAFRSLAYRRLGNSVMYLEKAPLGMFTEDAAPDASPKPAVVATAVAPIKAPVSVDAVGDSAADAAEPQLSAGTTLFVKNLAFSTSNEGLVQALRHLPGFAFARVQTKADAARPGVRLSAGYGFAGFKSKDEAKRALKALEGVVLDGHVLTVRWAGRGAEEETEAKGEGKARSAKMIVKNVPFEATKKDIQELFGAHAQLKSVRLPRKFDHRTRGFAFLEFVSPHEAARAYSTLRHTHLLGRHLVLEWAEDGAADIEELRKKAGVGFGGGKDMPGRKRKLNLGDKEGNDVEEL
ncbi:hypothetical protein POSPLADRAFT_1175052 [Postia placenta MAD-698-R-SB12]|uniref:RRM domain-containing protein n=1 Tax=Postia placenta MAD-698-R-SB12 TaxID=670580 RepID=A0A1X6MKT8_9APHY|nr:hypothetical protein POSPLADRAFT_1175052 [Postia placenta MAD-698-R-SB12]OSX56663.1 hypothetical protein POSPLADRAFT_1175052 [Postia placenta MAD-698-R-SB12]